jgi:anti-sigma factor RsiW
MNCQDIESKLADYLGEELEAAARTAFEAHLGRCPKCRTEVHDLGGTIDTLRTLPGVSTEDARRHTADLIVMRRPAPLRRAMITSLKAAAMLGFGIILGWAAFGRVGDGDASAKNPAPHRVVMEEPGIAPGVHPAWYERGRKVASAPSSFARHLAMIAPTGK